MTDLIPIFLERDLGSNLQCIVKESLFLRHDRHIKILLRLKKWKSELIFCLGQVFRLEIKGLFIYQ